MCCFRPSSIAAFITDINSVRSGTADVPPVQNTVDSGFSVGRCELHILSVVDHIKVFYRATLCVSAVLAVGRVYLSVCHTPVLNPNG